MRRSLLILRLLVLGLSLLLRLLILLILGSLLVLGLSLLLRLLILLILRSLLILGLLILRLSCLLRTLNRLLTYGRNGRILRSCLLCRHVRIGNRKTGTAVCGLSIIVAEYALLIVLALLLSAVIESGETGSNDCYFHFILHVRIDPGAENDVCGGVDNALYQLCRIVNFVECKVFAADNVEYNAARALDCGRKKRAVYRNPYGLNYSVLAFGNAYAEVGNAFILKDGLNVGEVEVDERRVNYEFGNTLDALL